MFDAEKVETTLKIRKVLWLTALTQPAIVYLLAGYVVVYGWAVSSSKCKKCSVMLLKVERIRCKQLSGALEAERFARPSV